MLRKSLFVGVVVATIASFFVQTERASAQICAADETVKPWFLIVFDTSGSMAFEPHDIENSCGFSPLHKNSAARCAVQNIVNATPDAEFGLLRFNPAQCDEDPASALMTVELDQFGGANILPWVDDDTGAPGELGADSWTPLGGSLALAQEYLEGATAFTAPSVTNPTALGCRPVNVILLTDGQEICDTCPGGGVTLGCPKAEADAFDVIDPLSCISTCSDGEFTTAPERAYELLTEMDLPSSGSDDCTGSSPDPGCVSVPINTYVIGFGIPDGDDRIEDIAIAGGTDNSLDGPGGLRAFYAGNEADLSEALARIIFESQLSESCDGVDNDCDGHVDEDNPTWCDIDGIRTENPRVIDPVSGVEVFQDEVAGSNLTETCSGGTCVEVDGTPDVDVCDDATCYDEKAASCSPVNKLCESPGEVCDQQDNDCDGDTDEGPFVQAPPPEDCSTPIDDDCDDKVNEECPPSCPPETCNNTDDDCDGEVDEDLDRSCGFAIGECTVGTQICVLGEWGAICPGGASGSGCSVDQILVERTIPDQAFPSDWVTDEGTCDKATTEICDGLDNDCNFAIDDNVDRVACIPDVSPPDGMDDWVAQGICSEGTAACDYQGPADMYGECEFFTGPETEICDGLDNDCDGSTDEADGSGMDGTLTRDCGSDLGICTPGTQQCTMGTAPDFNDRWGTCTGVTPGTELCNYTGPDTYNEAFDEDCDGRMDESDPLVPEAPNPPLDCVPDGDGAPELSDPTTPDLSNGTNTGLCSYGTIQCIDGVLECRDFVGPAAELCDDEDQDCDGGNVTYNDGNDDVVPNVGMPGAAVDTDLSLGGLCIDLSVFSDPGPSVPGFPDAQPGLGACTLGTLVCDLTLEAPVCVGGGSPSDETCDNSDEDCDGPIDEDAISASTPCETGDDPGNANRIGGDLPYPSPNFRQYCARCVDVDGDIVECRESLLGASCTDDQFDSAPGDPDGYGAATSWGSIPDCCGEFTRESAWEFGNLTGLHNGEGECELGTLACLAGEETCSGEITPTNEDCDGFDNDCDGVIDEDVPVGMPCGSSIGICEEGTLQCPIVADPTPGKDYVCTGGRGPDDMELCDGLDNNCNGFIDEGNPEGGGDCGGNSENCTRNEDPTDTGTPLVPCGDCEFGVLTCITLFEDVDNPDLPTGGELQCLGDTGPRPEVCDGRDNDCDSQCLVEDNGDIICPGGPTDSDDKIDEDLSADDRIGEDCGEDEGECEFGELVCTGGGVVCQGGVGPQPEMCDGLDNDCDGSRDEGIPVGAACFTLGEDEDDEPLGECGPGFWICDPDTGELECEGQIGPSDEACDGLDNDCDGKTDEGLGLGEECGTDEGLCEKGRFACVDGTLVCQGEVTPTPETCDCSDNDCDGNIDEESDDSSLCPGNSACVMCQCALPCTEGMEFAAQCPQGKAAVTVDRNGMDQCFCVGEQCKLSECSQEIQEVDGELVCHPDSDDVAACTCKNNECASVCSGVVCDSGLVCDQTDGRCKQPSCLLKQFECEGDQRCQLEGAAWSCVDDPCADRECAEDEACRDGTCFKSCATVECESGNQCVDGNCVPDRCFGKQCAVGEVCNPEDGECVLAGECVRSGCADGEVCDPVGGECGEDPCLSTRCPHAQQCNSETGQCEPRCFGNLLFCDDSCINPQTSKTNCGATGDCMGDNDGDTCGDDQVCSRGECGDSCADGLLNCGGECIDPNTDQMHCGASGSCTGSDEGTVCQTGFVCMSGRCRSILGGDDQDDAGDPSADVGERVIASGGGGCTCTVPVGAVVTGNGGEGSARGPMALGLIGLALLALGRRRRLPWLRSLGATQWLLLALLSLSFFMGGCKVDTFCLDCPSGDDTSDQDQDAGVNPIDMGDASSSGNNQTGDGDGDSDPLGDPDSGTIQPDACTPIEVCNGVDDDCDGKTDEDVDPAMQGLDYDTDVNNCGGCGNVCRIEHAFPSCEAGVCGIDRTQGDNGCDVGFHDLNKDEEDGCEYRCTETSEEDALCDLLDNDCDGEVDEDIEFDTDPNNCGSCGFSCKFANAENGGTCVNGICLLDDNECDEGFKNLDGIDENGCERRCDVWPTVDELCNLVDDDCDGRTNEGVADTDPLVNVECGIDTGLCEFGTTECKNGAVECEGGTISATEVCDGDDNDCDGSTDESDPSLINNPQCGTAIGICELGEFVCNLGTGMIECGGPNLVEPLDDEICNNQDDDCDGRIDENVVDGARNLDDGYKCSELSGSLEVFDPGSSATGQCQYGDYVCIGGTLSCQGEVGPAGEQCDNLDHDCDGEPVTADLDELVGPEPLGDTCGNQLGICTPGESTCVNSGTVPDPDWGVTGCEGGTPPADAELCNLLDDDCDGIVNDPGDLELGDPNGDCWIEDVDDDFIVDEFRWGQNDTGECSTGNAVCSTQGGGTFLCVNYQGPQAETCDGNDEDCDGNTDEDAEFVGQLCAVDPSNGQPYEVVGRCVAGTWACVDNGGNVLECQGGTPPLAVEYCNGVDDNCNRSVDEGWVPEPGQNQDPMGTACCPDDPDTPWVDVCDDLNPTCNQGAVDCRAGGVTCIADAAWAPDTEVCDGVDNDCDGIEDEDFKEGGVQSGVYNSQANCGSCGNDCNDIDPSTHIAVQFCDDTPATPVCAIAIDPSSNRPVCEPGWTDDPSPGSPDVDCDYECTFLGDNFEVCDGLDNDCDGAVDEVADLASQAPVLEDFCLTAGACSTATVQCAFNAIEGAFQWECTDQPSTFIDDCDDPEDQDCDGLTDEDVNALAAGVSAAIVSAGEDCEGPGVGECRLDGTLACQSGGDGLTLTCVDGMGDELMAGTGGAEACDGLDNDCDGKDDEVCYDQTVCTDPDDDVCIAANVCAPDDATCIATNMVGPDLGCVMDDWRDIGAGVFVYAYEAGRPDATSMSSGSDDHRACSSIPGGDTARRPWVNISYSDALSACQAIGARLCTRAEWRVGCDCGGTGPDDYGWSDGSGSGGACTTTPGDSPCNFDSNNDGISAGVDATPTDTDCYVHGVDDSSIYDMTGNVREYTMAGNEDGFLCRVTDSDCKIMTRGGAENSFEVGAACGYENSFWGDDAPFGNIGFRCCFGETPEVNCVTYGSSDTPISVTDGSNIASSITVSGVDAMFTTLTDIQVSVNGRNEDVDDMSWTISDGTVTRTLLDADGCDNNLDQGYKLQFRDAAASLPDISGECPDTKFGEEWLPATGQELMPVYTTADNTWTVTALNADGNNDHTLQDWSIRFCGTTDLTVPSAPAGDCEWDYLNGHSYFFCDTARDQATAKALCTGAGMDLARIDDETENAWIAARLAAASWIGAEDTAAEGAWRWGDPATGDQFWTGTSGGSNTEDDGTMCGYPSAGCNFAGWSSGEPNDSGGEHCATTDGGGGWNDLACGSSAGVVCEDTP